MLQIDFLQYQEQLKFKTINRKRHIWDDIRKKYIQLTPEETVRQLVIQYLIADRNYNKNRISIEQQLIINTLIKRCDILVYSQQTQPYLLVECKAPNVPISQSTFDQIAQYNLALNVSYLVVTNGLVTFCCKMDTTNQQYSFLAEIPSNNVNL